MLLDEGAVGRRVVERGRQHVLLDALRNAVAVGDGLRILEGVDDRTRELADIVATVPAALELEHLVAAGEGAGQAQGGDGRLAARRLKADRLPTRDGPDDLLGEADRRL